MGLALKVIAAALAVINGLVAVVLLINEGFWIFLTIVLSTLVSTLLLCVIGTTLENTRAILENQNEMLRRLRRLEGEDISGNTAAEPIPAWMRVQMEKDGVPVPEPPEGPKPAQKFCPHCDAKITQEQTACYNCGEKL